MKKKALLYVVSLLLVALVAVGGTLAWLKASTTPVVNTFAPSNIGLTLEEATKGPYKMVPGAKITKDPVVTVDKNSEPCWVFVKVEKAKGYDTYLEPYEIAAGWTALTGVDGVYYCKIDDPKTVEPLTVLKDNQVKVKTTVTKEQMAALDTQDKYPTLTFTAYAIQQEGFTTPEAAWAEASK